MPKKLLDYYPKAKSLCTCGHTGDGPNSEHGDRVVSNGHGGCKLCDCQFFTWSSWLPEFERYWDATHPGDRRTHARK